LDEDFTTILVTGILFTFALLVMPGLGRLGDRAFQRGFQEIDRIIQNGYPVFVIVWQGSVISLVAAAAMGLGQLDGLARGPLLAAARRCPVWRNKVRPARSPTQIIPASPEPTGLEDSKGTMVPSPMVPGGIDLRSEVKNGAE
jgi:hypothetical protein